MKPDLETLISILAHSGSLKILYSLRNGAKRPKELTEDTKLDKTIIWRRVRELFQIGLIEVIIRHDTPTGIKAYKLTPLGERILEILDEMKKELNEYHNS